MAIVAALALCHGVADFLNILEDTAVDGLLLERPVEAFSDAIGLRLIATTSVQPKGASPAFPFAGSRLP